MLPSRTEFDDPSFLDRLRKGDADAYRLLIRRFHGSLVGVAAAIIGSHAQAEEVVQDAWLAVYSGIGRFEGRSALATWLFSIVLNRARTRRGREIRLVPLPEEYDPSADALRFHQDGHWIDAPRPWDDLNPERVVGGVQLWAHVQAAIERLPAGQKAVIILRDVEGQDAETACALLGLTPENQRVLLHRARMRVRDAIDTLIGTPARRAAPAKPSAVSPPRPGIAKRMACALRAAAAIARAAAGWASPDSAAA